MQLQNAVHGIVPVDFPAIPAKLLVLRGRQVRKVEGASEAGA